MATGAISLPIAGAVLDATDTPQLQTETNTLSMRVLRFDKDSDRKCCWQFRTPDDYDNGTPPYIIVTVDFPDANTGDARLRTRVMSTPVGGTVDWDFQTPDAYNDHDIANPGTDLLKAFNLTLTNRDSMAAGHMTVVELLRDGDDATNDDADSDMILRDATLIYTKS